MIEIANFGQPIELYGQSGERYSGRIYDKKCISSFTGRAIVCLSNSSFSEHTWKHNMNSIFQSDDVTESFKEFQNRDDISHVIIIPLPVMKLGNATKVEDLIHKYLHS